VNEIFRTRSTRIHFLSSMGNVTKSNGHRYEQGVSNGGRAGGGVLIILHAIVIYMTIDLASLQRRDGARRVFAGPGSGGRVLNMLLISTSSNILSPYIPIYVIP